MAFKIEKEDKRPSVSLSLSVPAELYDLLVARAGIAESSVKYTVLKILEADADQNKKSLVEWIKANPAKHATLSKPERTRQNSGKSQDQSGSDAGKSLTAKA